MKYHHICHFRFTWRRHGHPLSFSAGISLASESDSVSFPRAPITIPHKLGWVPERPTCAHLRYYLLLEYAHHISNMTNGFFYLTSKISETCSGPWFDLLFSLFIVLGLEWFTFPSFVIIIYYISTLRLSYSVTIRAINSTNIDMEGVFVQARLANDCSNKVAVGTFAALLSDETFLKLYDCNSNVGVSILLFFQFALVQLWLIYAIIGFWKIKYHSKFEACVLTIYLLVCEKLYSWNLW